jgi:hypothetical protein
MTSPACTRIGPGCHASWVEYARTDHWSDKTITSQPFNLALSDRSMCQWQMPSAYDEKAAYREPGGAGARTKALSNDRIPCEGSARKEKVRY